MLNINGDVYTLEAVRFYENQATLWMKHDRGCEQLKVTKDVGRLYIDKIGQIFDTVIQINPRTQEKE